MSTPGSPRGPALGPLALVVALALAAGNGPARAAEERLVTVGGAVTEIVAALGAADRIVAVDTTSTFPPAVVAGKPNVGYMRQLSAEGVLSFAPARVVAVEGAGPPDVLTILREAGMPVETVAEGHSPEGLLAKVRRVGDIVGRREAAEVLAASLADRFDRLAEARARTVPARVLFVLSIQNGRPMVAGTATAADAIIRLAGAVNVGAGFQGYRVMTDEALIAARPDAIVTMTRHGSESPAAAFGKLPALADTPAVRSGAVVVMDGLYLLGFGPRTPEAAEDLMKALQAKRAAAGDAVR